MPIYEFICPKHGKFEKIVKVDQHVFLCEQLDLEAKDPGQCGETCKRVAAEVPARRDPRYGIG